MRRYVALLPDALVDTHLANKVNENEDSGLKVVLEAINECKRQKSDFHSRLTKSFGTCLNLTNLNLYYNGIGGAGATSIAEAIKVNETLNQFGFVWQWYEWSRRYIYCWGNQSQQDANQFEFV